MRIAPFLLALPLLLAAAPGEGDLMCPGLPSNPRFTSTTATTGNFSTLNALFVDAGTVQIGGSVKFDNNIPCATNGSVCLYSLSSIFRVYVAGADRLTINNGTGAVVLGSVGATTAVNASTLGMNFTTANLSGNLNSAGSWTWTGTSTELWIPQAVTAVADDGAGTSPAFTVNATPGTGGGRNLTVSCLDANGCTMTLTESGAAVGQVVCIINRTTGTVTVADTAGVQESSGTVLGEWDSACFLYITDRWVQTSAQNN